MKTITLLIAMLLSGYAFSQIPVFEWVAPLQYVNPIAERSITTDSDENVLITGYFSGYQDFDPGPAELLIESNGGLDLFIEKLDSDGNLLWVRTMGNSVNQRGLCVVTDSAGNVFVNGNMDNGTVDLDPGPGVTNISSAAGVRGFIVSLDANGDFNWAYALPGFSGNNAIENQLSCDPAGGLVITERFGGTVDFDPGPGVANLTASGVSAYVLKLNATGDFVWAKALVDGFGEAKATYVLESGDIFVTGTFGGTVDFDPGAGVFNLTSNGLSDVFVLKLDSGGNFLLARSFGGSDIESPTNISSDNTHNVYISGLFEGTTDLNPGPGTYNVTAVEMNDPFIVKLDAAGNFLWGHTYGGTLDDIPVHITADTAGNAYVTGRFYSTLDFDPGPAIYNQSPGPSSILTLNADVFISKLAPDGSLIWFKTVGGEDAEYGDAISVSAPGNVYVAGKFDDTVDFNPGSGVDIYTSLATADAFNLKYSQCYQATPVPDAAMLSDTISACAVDTLIPPTASEFCTGTIVGVPDVVFPITTPGITAITWTYNAGGGNVITQIQNVIITDNEAPVPDLANLPAASFACSATSLTPPAATDNCSGTILVTNNAVFPILADAVVTWTYDDGNGNTSSQTQQIIITPIDNGVTQPNVITLTANASGYNYQWLDCANGNTPITGATNQTFIAAANGTYAVELSNNTCSVVSACFAIEDVGIDEPANQKAVVVSPNPTTGKLTVDTGKHYAAITLKLKTLQGQELNRASFGNAQVVEWETDASAGIYLLEIGTENGVLSVKRIVKI